MWLLPQITSLQTSSSSKNHWVRKPKCVRRYYDVIVDKITMLDMEYTSLLKKGYDHFFFLVNYQEMSVSGTISLPADAFLCRYY